MKKIILLFAIILAFTGCINNNVDVKTDELKIVTSFYPVYLFTQNVTKDVPDVSVKNLTLNSSTGCLHGYHLTTANMKDIEEADAFIINGANMEESFLEDIKTSYPDLIIIDTSVGVEVVKNTFTNEDNSHIWLSTSNAKKQVENIKNGLINIDNKNSEIYTKNTESFLASLDEIEMQESYDYNVVAMHDSLYYFAESLGINIIDIIQNEEDDVPSPKRLQEIIQNIKDNNVKAIFAEEKTDKLANMLSDETGVKVYVFDSITSGEGKQEEYISRMKNNIETIKQIAE